MMFLLEMFGNGEFWCGVWHPNFEGVWMKIPPSIWFGLQFLSHTQLYRSNGIYDLGNLKRRHSKTAKDGQDCGNYPKIAAFTLGDFSYHISMQGEAPAISCFS